MAKMTERIQKETRELRLIHQQVQRLLGDPQLNIPPREKKAIREKLDELFITFKLLQQHNEFYAESKVANKNATKKIVENVKQFNLPKPVPLLNFFKAYRRDLKGHQRNMQEIFNSLAKQKTELKSFIEALSPKPISYRR